MIDLMKKLMDGKKAPATVTGLALAAVLWIQNSNDALRKDIADVRERLVRIETKLGIDKAYVQR
jgi:hypothetical protein